MAGPTRMIDMWGPCRRCGNVKEDELNFEGRIHHGTKVLCFDTKACAKRVKKSKKK